MGHGFYAFYEVELFLGCFVGVDEEAVESLLPDVGFVEWGFDDGAYSFVDFVGETYDG